MHRILNTEAIPLALAALPKAQLGDMMRKILLFFESKFTLEFNLDEIRSFITSNFDRLVQEGQPLRDKDVGQGYFEQLEELGYFYKHESGKYWPTEMFLEKFTLLVS